MTSSAELSATRSGMAPSAPSPGSKAQGRRKGALSIPMVLVAAGLAGLVACTDNATKLSIAIEGVTEQRSGASEMPLTIDYRPKKNPEASYFLIFLPDRRVRPEDLVAAGIPWPQAARIFFELSYVGIGDRPFLIVDQTGSRLSFTTHWTRFASVRELLVIRGQGTTTLTLSPSAGGWVVEGAR